MLITILYNNSGVIVQIVACESRTVLSGKYLQFRIIVYPEHLMMFAILSDIVLYIRHPVNNNNNNVGKYKMLPRSLYELLPFLYISTGILSAALIDSTIVLISSILLIVTGVFILKMRRSFRKKLRQKYILHQAAYESDDYDGIEKRSGTDRRRSKKVTEWPVVDNAGKTIFSERRKAERRISVT
jgi:hypothetical protein